jgi:putative peptidoglycan lipid II flippase
MRLKLSLGAVAAANLLAALAFQWVILTTLGVGGTTDALFAGMAIPQLVLSVVSGSLVSVLIPVLAGEPEEALRETAWGSFLLVSGAAAVLATLLFVAAPVWVGWLFPGFRSRDLGLAVSLTRIQLPGMVFSAALAVPLAAWNARSRFLWPEVAPLLATLVCLLPLPALLARSGVTAAAWLSTGKSLLFLLLVLPGLGAFRRPVRRSEAQREIGRRLLPLLGGSAYYKSDTLVDRALSSLAPPGELSILYLGQQLWNAASQVLTVGIGRPLVPALSTQAKQGRWSEFRGTLLRHLRPMLLLVLLGAAAFAAVGRPILALLIGHGGVTSANVDLLWRVMLVLTVAFAAGCLGQLTSQAFYALGDTRTPTRLGILTFTVYVPLKFVAFRAFGIYGLAASTGLFVLVNVALQYVLLSRRLRRRIA